MLRSFEKKLIEHHLLRKGEGIVVGVSGGIDSMVLLDLLYRLSKSWRLRVTVAHVNHGLRGKASDADHKLVRRVSQKLNLGFSAIRWKVPSRDNIQDAARRFRYDFFRHIAEEIGATSIATAHNQGDQAETLLLHLIRGSGIKGLSGIMRSHGDETKIIRPLLDFSRGQIEEYAKKRHIVFTEDITNQKTMYRRNFIRHNILPILETLNPCIKETLADTAFTLQDTEQALHRVAQEFAKEFFRSGKKRIIWDRTHFIELPTAIRRHILILAYEKLCGDRTNLNSDQILHMDMISSGTKGSGHYNLPRGIEFSRTKDLISIGSRKCVMAE
jgi:tRNA(Ile)-lysidine synthase